MARLTVMLRRSRWLSFPTFLIIFLIIGLYLTASLDTIHGNIRNTSSDRKRHVVEEEERPSIHQTPSSVGILKESSASWNCTKQLAFLTPSMGPFKAWREYKQLQELFQIEHGVSQFRLACPIQRCNLIIGATLKDKPFLRNSDGAVINIAPNLLKRKLGSTVKTLNDGLLSKDVTWFFLGMESPQMFTFWDPEIANISYHYDIAYHSQSALPVPYGKHTMSDRVDIVLESSIASMKTHLIAWMASNCQNTFWPRTEFVHDLQKYIPIDMYGKCGNLSCLPPMSLECNNMLGKYKFYLALENTECDEYITEKFWDNCLQHNVVPVVYGGRRAPYERLAPPNSFIHVGDFATTKELADYLLELDKDDVKYNQYFQWKTKGHVKVNYPPFNPSVLCDTIPFLNSKERKTNTVLESKYFNSCREKPTGVFAEVGSYGNWSPWK